MAIHGARKGKKKGKAAKMGGGKVHWAQKASTPGCYCYVAAGSSSTWPPCNALGTPHAAELNLLLTEVWDAHSRHLLAEWKPNNTTTTVARREFGAAHVVLMQLNVASSLALAGAHPRMCSAVDLIACSIAHDLSQAAGVRAMRSEGMQMQGQSVL